MKKYQRKIRITQRQSEAAMIETSRLVARLGPKDTITATQVTRQANINQHVANQTLQELHYQGILFKRKDTYSPNPNYRH